MFVFIINFICIVVIKCPKSDIILHVIMLVMLRIKISFNLKTE